jgi:metallo-beta-lactamase family protein
MKRSGKIPGKVPVFLNSPLAINMTRLYKKHCAYCQEEIFAATSEPFDFPGLVMTESVEESMAIHSVDGPKIVLAGSGMMTGGRIKHHLKHLLWKESTTLIIVGYQAEGTLGRKIIDGAETVKLFGVPVSVKAKVYTINGFSAHAARSHLIDFAKRAHPKHIFVVHGEPESSRSLAQDIGKVLPAATITVPTAGQKFHI